MAKIKNTLQMTSLLFAMTMLFCYIAWTLNYEGFILVGHIDISIWIIRIIGGLLLCINLSLLCGFVLDIYSFKTLYFSVPIVLFCGFFPLAYGSLNGPLTTAILLLLIYPVKRNKKERLHFVFRIFSKTLDFKINECLYSFVKLILITIITLSYQWVISKISLVDLNAYISIYQALRLSVNSILLKLLIYFIGGVTYVRYNKQANRRYANRVELVVFPQLPRDYREDSSSLPKSVDGIPLTKLERNVMMSVVMVAQMLQWAFILWVCNFDNPFLDALAMTTSFICHGMIISKRRHLKPVILCTLAATAMFHFAVRFTFSFHYSQFFPIFIGLILVYTMWRIDYQFKIKDYEKAKKKLDRIAELEKQLDEVYERLDELS